MDTFKASIHRRGSTRSVLTKIFSILICLAVITSLVFFNRRFLIVTTITCQSDNSPCPEAVISLTENYKGQSILLLRQRQLINEIKATGLADAVKLSIKLPGQLIVHLTPPATSFYLKSFFGVTPPRLTFEDSTISAEIIAPSIELSQFVASINGKTFRLLPSGVLDQSDNDTNYYLIASEIPKSSYLLDAFSWLKAITDAKMTPQAIYLLPQILVVKVKDQPDYLFSLSSDPPTTLLALQRLIMAVTISELSVIDFRYSNPILK